MKTLEKKQNDTNAKTQLTRHFVNENRKQDAARFAANFPTFFEITSSDLFPRMFQIAGISPVHTMTVERMFELKMDCAAVIESLLPSLYCRFLDAGCDEIAAFQRAIGAQIGVLKCLKDRLETYISRGLEEAINLALLVHSEELRVDVHDTAFFKRKYRGVSARRGPKPPKSEKTRDMRMTYQTLISILRPVYEKGGSKMAAIEKAVDLCNERISRIDSEKTMDAEPTIDMLRDYRSYKEIAVYLTSRVCNTSPATVKRYR